MVKAHSAHPGTSELVAGAIARAVEQHGLPEGVFSMVFGAGREVGITLVTDPHIKAVGFTGSRTAGVALMQAAAARPVPIPVYAEMSSINPVFLLPGALAADTAGLAQAYVDSLTVGVGQLCTNPGLVFAVDGPELDDLPGRGRRPPCPGVPGAADAQRRHPRVVRRRGRPADRRRRRRARWPPARTTPAIASPGPGAWSSRPPPTPSSTQPALQEEVFGAASLVVRVSSADELAGVAAGLEGQLTATVHATESDHAAAGALIPVLEDKVGRIVFNGWPTGVDVGHAMVHGGPFPATADGRSTSVGTLAIERFLRPVAYQNVPPALLPAAVDVPNSLGIWREVDGELGRE